MAEEYNCTWYICFGKYSDWAWHVEVESGFGREDFVCISVGMYEGGVMD